jgi:hypothetical protein
MDGGEDKRRSGKVPCLGRIAAASFKQGWARFLKYACESLL